MFSLHGKTALVTGGAQNIGLAIARHLAQAGALVTVADPTPPPQPHLLRHHPCDITDENSVRPLMTAHPRPHIPHPPLSLRMFSLHGKTALVTGGVQNIGLAIARHLAQAGALVTVADPTPPPPPLRHHPCDITDENSVRPLMTAHPHPHIPHPTA